MADTNFVDQQTIIEADWLQDVNDLIYKTWQIVLVSSNILICDTKRLITLNEDAPATVNDITSTLDGIPIIIFRNSRSNTVTFTNNGAKLRNISGANVVLGQNQSITYAFVSGTVWQQIAGAS